MGLWAQVKRAFAPQPRPTTVPGGMDAALVSYLLNLRDDDNDIIGAFGALMERQMDTHEARRNHLRAQGVSAEDIAREMMVLRPESELPYPKERIREALERALALNPPSDVRESLGAGLRYLRLFVPDADVLRYGPDTWAEWLRRTGQ